MRGTRLLAIVAAVALAGGCTTLASSAAGSGAAGSGPFDRASSDRAWVKTSFIALPVTAGGKTWTTAGELREPLIDPAEARARPAVVIVHGSGGVDSRGGAYAEALNRAGFVTLEIDLWAARGVASPADRPKAVAETLPDAFAALAFLSTRPGVDAGRVGIMGFSWGGVVSMLSASRAANQTHGRPGLAFAAHAPLYPVCWVYNRVPGYEFADLTGAPVLLQAGAGDLYDDPDSCEKLGASLPEPARSTVTVITYAGATHAWDRREPDITANDPFSHKGAGGEVPFHYDASVTRRSTEAVVAFFGRVLGRP